MKKKIIGMYSRAFSGLPSGAWMLSLVVLINRSGTMVLFFISLYLTGSLHYSITDAGTTITIYGLGAMAGSYLGGRLSDSLGVGKVQVLSLLFSGIVLIMLGYLETLPAINVMMFNLALVSEAFRPANATAIAKVCPPESRARCYGLNRLAVNVGVTIGPAIGGFLASLDYLYLFWVDGLTCLVAALFLALFYKKGKIKTFVVANPIPVEEKSPYRDRQFLWFTFLLFFMGFVFAQVFSTWPLYLKQQNLFSENIVGLLLALNAIFVAIVEMPLIHRYEKKNPIKIITIGTVFFFVGFAILPFSGALWFAAFSVITWSLGEILIFPLATGFVANRSGPGNTGKYMGLFNFNFAFSMVVGPVAGSWIYENAGPEFLWYFIGLLGLLVVAGFKTLDSVMQKAIK